MNPTPHPRLLGPVLVMATMVTAVVSSLGAPLIPTIADDFQVSLSSAQWSLTVTLLTGAVCAPVMGRLGDGPRRRATTIGGSPWSRQVPSGTGRRRGPKPVAGG